MSQLSGAWPCSKPFARSTTLKACFCILTLVGITICYYSHRSFICVILDSVVFMLPKGVPIPLPISNIFGEWKHEFGEEATLLAFQCLGVSIYDLDSTAQYNNSRHATSVIA